MTQNKVHQKAIDTKAYYAFLLMVLLLPLSFYKGLENSFNLVKSFVLTITGCIFVVSAILAISKQNKGHITEILFDFRFDIPLFIFFISILFSSLFSSNFYSAFNGSYDRQMGLLFYFILLIVYLLSSLVLISRERIIKLLFVMETAGVLISIFPVAELFGLNPFGMKPAGFTRPFSPAGHPIFTAGILTLIIPVSLLNLSGKKSKILKFLYPSLIVAGIVLTLTRASIAALIVQVLIIISMKQLINKSGKFNAKTILKPAAYFAAGLLIVAAITLLFFPDSLPARRIYSITDLTTQPRWFLWKDSIEMFKHNFVFGSGPGNFSFLFENYASYQLKLAEIGRIYDNAHNNLINVLCTYGIFGGVSYAFLIITLLILTFKMATGNNTGRFSRIFFLSMFCSFTGYAIFGLADFDDITIAVFFIIFISVFKSNLLLESKESFKVFRLGSSRAGLHLVITVIIIFMAYASYSSGSNLVAEVNYSESLKSYNSGDFYKFQALIKYAIALEPNQMEYRFKHATYLFDYCTRQNTLSAAAKSQMLEEATKEVLLSSDNYISKLKCMELQSLIELENGNKAEGLKLRDVIFAADTCRFSYRTNLAMYYLRNNEDSTAERELKIILKFDPKGIDANSAYLIYLEKNKRYAEAISICRTILDINPGNDFAKKSFLRISQLIEKGK